MASKVQVPVATTQGGPSLSRSLPASTGSVPIRAPITVDDDSSDFDSNAHETDNYDSVYSNTGSSSDNESERFVSGEEFETASERPFVGDPDWENPEDGGFVDKYELSRPFVVDPYVESSENSVVEEEDEVENGATNEYSSVEIDGSKSTLVVPIARLSMEDDDLDGCLGDEGMVSEVGDGFSGIVKIPSFGVAERINSEPQPRAVVLSAEEGKDDELLGQVNYSGINESALLLVENSENLVLDKVLVADNNVLGSKDVAVVVKSSAQESVSVGLAEDDGHLATSEGNVESLVEAKEAFLGENLQLHEDNKHFFEERLSLENLVPDKIDFNDSYGDAEMSVGDDVSEEHGAKLREEIAEIVGGSDDSHEIVKNSVDVRLNFDDVVQLREKVTAIINGSDDSLESVMNPLDEMGVKGVGEEAYELTDCRNQEVESLANIIELNEMQTADLLANGELHETSEGDRLKVSWLSNTNPHGIRNEADHGSEKLGQQKSLLSDEDIEELIFGISRTANDGINEYEHGLVSSLLGAESSHDHPQRIDGQIVTDLDKDIDQDRNRGEKKSSDYAALLTLLKAATTAESDGGSFTIASSGDSRAFSLEHPAGLRSSFHTMKGVSLPDMAKDNLSENEKKLLENIQHTRVKFLRLVQRLGKSPEDFVVAQVLHSLGLAVEGLVSQEFCLESAKRIAMQLEAEGKDDLDVSLNMLVLGKTGVGKSATINSIFGEKKVMINAFEPSTTKVKATAGIVDGVKIRILDTPGLRLGGKGESKNWKILKSIRNVTRKFSPDVVLYVDRLDNHARDLNDLPLLRMLTDSLTASIWRNAIITLTHAAAPLPDGPQGSPLSFEMFVTQRSRVIQQAISQAVGDMRLMNPSRMCPVSLVENHPLCEKSENREHILPNGGNWRQELLFLCYSLKILSEANSISKPQDPSHHKKPFGSRLRSIFLPHLVSSLLQFRTHLKVNADEGGDDIDSDIEFQDLLDSNEEDEDDYDQLPPFKPLRKSQVDKLSKEQREAYFDEYDYRVKLLQKKQCGEEMKKKGKYSNNNSGNILEDVDQEDGGPATVPVPIGDFVLPPSFDSDNPSYRYRMLEPTSPFLVRPVLNSQGWAWDHDCGYEALSIERNLAIADQFPSAFAVQITKDKKDFSIYLDSSICVKHGERGSTLAGFDIQTVGNQLAYILRSETKFKNFKMNKTTAGISITLLNENIATGLKIEDQIALGKRLSLVGSAGTVRSGGDAAHGANFEVRLKSKDFPIEQDQSTLGFSLMKWRGDLGLMATLESQFSVTRNSKMAVRVGMKSKQSGQITIKTSSSELQVALISILPVAISIFKSIYPSSASKGIPDY